MQKFHKGDLVRVAKDLGPTMRHFTADCNAIVLGSYSDQYGRHVERNDRMYTIFIEHDGRHSWYNEDQLTLIKADALDVLAQWEADERTTREREGDLDWIFAQGPKILERCSGASAEALAAPFSNKSLWGSRGEGITFYQNARIVLMAARPFLESHDKAGWLANCARIKNDVGSVNKNKKEEGYGQ